MKAAMNAFREAAAALVTARKTHSGLAIEITLEEYGGEMSEPDHRVLVQAATAANERIQWLEHGLLVCVSRHEGCATVRKCGYRDWSNPQCACAQRAREYLPVNEW